MKNGNVIMDNDWKFYYKDIQYLLIPVDDQLSTYIIQEPNKYLYHFHHATISYEIVIKRNSTIDEGVNAEIKPFRKTDLTLYTIKELCQSLFSINKIGFVNDILYGNDSPSYLSIEFFYLKLKIFDSSGKMIKKIICVAAEDNYGLDAAELLEALQDVYYPKSCGNMESKYLIINPRKNRWYYNKFTHKNCIYGISLLDTGSFVFHDIFDMEILKQMSSIYSQLIVYPKEKILKNNIHELLKDIPNEFELEMELNILENGSIIGCYDKMVDYWVCAEDNIIEYLTYLPYLMLVLQTIYEIFDYDGYAGIYTVLSSLSIILKNDQASSIDFEGSTECPVTLNEVIQYCEGENL